MLGQHIVFEGVIKDRYVARQVVGETAAYWLVKGYEDGAEVKRKHKGAIRILASHPTASIAQFEANTLTKTLAEMKSRHVKEHMALLKKYGNLTE